MKIKTQIYFNYGITLVLAACSFLYQLLLAQAMSNFLADTAFCYSLTLGLYLAAMGFGSFLSNKIFSQRKNWNTLFRLELWLALLGALSVIVINFSYMLHSFLSLHAGLRAGVAVFFLGYGFMVLSVGFLTGIELPLLIKIGNELSGTKNMANRILATDYFGTLAGGFLFPLWLYPHFKLEYIGLMIASINLLVAGVVFILFVGDCKKNAFHVAGGFVLAVLLASGVMYHRPLHQYFQKTYYHSDFSDSNSSFFSWTENYPQIESIQSPYQKIDLVKFENKDSKFFNALFGTYTTRDRGGEKFPHNYYLFLNYEFQFSSENEEAYHEYPVHVPAILNKRVPRKVLVLGGGDGLIVRELLKYSEVREITLVELDKKMIELANQHPIFTYLNGYSLKDPRVKLIIGDAFHYARETKQTYDAVYIDFPIHIDYNLSKLYSYEFYYFVRQLLREDGFAVFDAPGIFTYFKSDRNNALAIHTGSDWGIYYNTLVAAGFQTIVPYSVNLEINNPLAIKFLSSKRRETAGRLDALEMKSMAEQYLHEYSNSRQESFVMVKERPEVINFDYKELGIELFVLNKERFDRSFPEYEKVMDRSKINSIMKPTLPRSNRFFGTDELYDPNDL